MARKVSSEQVINRAKMRLGLRDTTAADSDLEKYINEGAMHLDSLDSYIIECTELDIDCAKAKLPESATELIAYKFNDGNCNGCCGGNDNTEAGTFDVNMACMCGCFQWYTPDRNILTNFTGAGIACGYSCATFDVQNGYIHFPITVTATEVTVYYRGYNEDCEGLMVIDEYSERALSAYAAYQYACSGMNYKVYSDRQIQRWNQEWVLQRNKIIGRAVKSDFVQHKVSAAQIVGALILSPWVTNNRNI